MMHGHEKSRSAIVAVKPTNKAERTAAEPVERRAETKGSADQQRTRRTQRRIGVSKVLARIRQHIAAVDTQGRNRMRESCKYGSVRGARSNSRPYRDRVRRSSSSRPRGILRCVERCCPSAAQARRSETCSCARTCLMQARRRAGLRSFPGKPPGMARAQEHPAHGALHRAGAGSI
jgi:hypothetical protein